MVYMKYFILSILLFLVGCQTQKTEFKVIATDSNASVQVLEENEEYPIYSQEIENFSYITLEKQTVDTQNVELIPINQAEPYKGSLDKIEPNTYKVGFDIPEGKYLITPINEKGYLNILYDSGLSYESVKLHEELSDPKEISLKNGEYLSLTDLTAKYIE